MLTFKGMLTLAVICIVACCVDQYGVLVICLTVLAMLIAVLKTAHSVEIFQKEDFFFSKAFLLTFS